MANIIGPDVSFYQDDPQTPQGIDFAKMRTAAEYVILRAGQNLWPDRDFKANWRESKKAGLPRGSYWFYDSRANPKRQADLWVQQFGGDDGELPLFADLEERYNGNFKGWNNWYIFLERLKVLLPGKEIAIYTGYYYWLEFAPNPVSQPANLEYFHQYPLWIANYNPITEPLVPKPWSKTEWLFWQFTDNGDGTLYGVESLNIDLNYFNGDLEAFRTRFKLSPQPPPPPPPPIFPQYRVTATSLNVREGPGTNFKSLGFVRLNEIVEEIGANADRTWLNIRKRDGSLVGWSSATYLQKISSPIPDPNQGTYRVTTSSLKVFDGPGLSYGAIGYVYFAELVEKIGATSDNAWLNIRKLDGSLSGWSQSEFLIDANGQTPPPDPYEPPPPIPTHEDKNWYRVNAETLNIRETPSTSAKVTGTVYKNDTLPALDDSTSPDWIQIEKLDGLSGWCSRSYLVPLGTPRPPSMQQKLFNGITYFRKVLTAPRPIVLHVAVVDLKTPNFEFLVTPTSNPEGIICTRATSKFLEEFRMHFAVNGDGFDYLPTSYEPASYCPNGGDPVKTQGFAASRGKIYSPQNTVQPEVYIGARNQVSINVVPGNIFSAVAGDRMVVEKGAMVKNLAAALPNPRTAYGINKNGRWLTLMVIDGRQPGYSEGVTFPELANILISYGIYSGVNMDGGGSSTMVMKGADGKPRVLNSPIDMNVPGRQRKVANHLGIFIK